MSDPSILFVKPGAISAEDKSTLKESGVIVVEIGDPSAVKFIKASTELSGGDILRAACEAIVDTNGSEYASTVVKALGYNIANAVTANS